MITILPTSGLCNRMRAIDSAIAFGEKYQREVKVLWISDSDLTCPFSKLFKPIVKKNFTLHDLSFVPLKYRIVLNEKHLAHNVLSNLLFNKVILKKEFKKHIESNYDFNLLKNYKHVFLSSLSRFYPNDKMYKLFKPIDELQNKIDEAAKQFSTNTIGVHIRRTDHQNAIKYSPTSLFKKIMKEEVENNSSTNFYLASDSLSVKKELIIEFKDRIITQLSETSRTSVEGVQDALVDLYLLSKTKKILGSYYSSFSHTAAHISGIPEQTIKIDEVMESEKLAAKEKLL